MGRGENKAGAAKQGREEETERLGEAQQLGAGKSELEPEDQHVCAPSRTPATPLYWLNAPLPVQTTKNPITPHGITAIMLTVELPLAHYRCGADVGREEAGPPTVASRGAGRKGEATGYKDTKTNLEKLRQGHIHNQTHKYLERVRKSGLGGNTC